MAAIVSAVALELRKVRVTFDETVTHVNPEAAGDATNPANWKLWRPTIGEPGASAAPDRTEEPGPIVSPIVATSVEVVSDTVFDVLTSIDLSPGKKYLAHATGITDLDPYPGNTSQFVAFYPPQPEGRDFRIERWIPRKNWREDDTGDLRKFIDCLQDPLTILAYTVDQWTEILNPDRCSLDFIDAMLADLGNPFTYLDLTDNEKRRLALLLVDIYKLKGTGKGIKDAIRLFLRYEIQILVQNLQGLILGVSELGYDWILGEEGVEYDFQIRVGKASGAALTATEDAQIRAIVDFMKPAQTEMRSLISSLPPPAAASVTAAGHAEMITVAWGEVAGATGYRIYKRVSPNVSPFNSGHSDVGAGVLSWDDDPVDSGFTGYYVVVALNGADEGVASVEVSATAT